VSDVRWRTAERPIESPARSTPNRSTAARSTPDRQTPDPSTPNQSTPNRPLDPSPLDPSPLDRSTLDRSTPERSGHGHGIWVDDANSVVRRGMVASLLAEGIPVVGESAGLNPEPALARVKVLLFEADETAAPEVFQQARRLNIQLVATVRQPTGLRLRTLAEEGVAAILLMAELTPDTLVHAVRSAAQDRTTLSRSALMRLLEHAARLHPHGANQLTSRERLVLQLLADGKETRSIAQEMNYSERTVKNVVHDVLTKLNCRTRAQAVGVAMRSGII